MNKIFFYLTYILPTTYLSRKCPRLRIRKHWNINCVEIFLIEILSCFHKNLFQIPECKITNYKLCILKVHFTISNARAHMKLFFFFFQSEKIDLKMFFLKKSLLPSHKITKKLLCSNENRITHEEDALMYFAITGEA